ncbi:MAG: AarF/ABC1/UbiB kinase family protein [Alphaproteobacteria bacterium]|nr:AarF/ABC1/UbiB kinase family protein [Alphaproteobacteria bacterium]
MTDASDPERDRLSARLGRVAQVGANVAGAAAAAGAARVFGGDDARVAKALKDALGRSKGPLMKVAQLLATIPDLLPETYAAELRKLQSQAPAMGWPFVRRRMQAELGADWQTKYAQFTHEAVAAASLGQVHRAQAHDGRALAVKLQYPEMASAVEADLAQLRTLLAMFRNLDRTIDSSEAIEEVSARLREELDYERERKHMALFARIHGGDGAIRTPVPLEDLCTKRLLSMTWLQGDGLMAQLEADAETRNRLAGLLFRAWWKPMTAYGVIHGDPHLGNYSFTDEASVLNLLDFGCVRVFPPRFVGGVVALYWALLREDRDSVAAAYEAWGFSNLSNDLIDALSIWARFIFAPLLDDRVRTVADGVAPAHYGRKEVMEVRNRLRTLGPVTVPREFVFMDRAAIGLGAAFLHLRAELNFAQLFQASIEGFDEAVLAERQRHALARVGLEADA